MPACLRTRSVSIKGARTDPAYDVEIQEVHERILELNPSFNPHDWPVPELNVRVSSDPNDGLNALEKRGKAGPAHCGVFDYCNTRRIQRGIDHLNRLPGGCHIGWGTEKCSPVSCSHDASIILCNDVSFFFFPFHLRFGEGNPSLIESYKHYLSNIKDCATEFPRHLALVPTACELRAGYCERLSERVESARSGVQRP